MDGLFCIVVNGEFYVCLITPLVCDVIGKGIILAVHASFFLLCQLHFGDIADSASGGSVTEGDGLSCGNGAVVALAGEQTACFVLFCRCIPCVFDGSVFQNRVNVPVGDAAVSGVGDVHLCGVAASPAALFGKGYAIALALVSGFLYLLCLYVCCAI